MSVHQGKVNNCLSMTLYYNVSGQVSITMLSYVAEIITAFNKVDLKRKGTNWSATPNNIFVVNWDCKKLDQAKVVEFHNLVANSLYVNNRARPHTYTSISFITTRVWASNEDYWDTLVHLMQYLIVTGKLSLNLSANICGILKLWVYAPFAFHPNMLVHSGGVLSLWSGFPIIISTKKKINTKLRQT